jgi:hypothetical protein
MCLLPCSVPRGTASQQPHTPHTRGCSQSFLRSCRARTLPQLMKQIHRVARGHRGPGGGGLALAEKLVRRLVQVIAEMRKHPGRTALYGAMFATVQPENSRASAFIADRWSRVEERWGHTIQTWLWQFKHGFGSGRLAGWVARKLRPCPLIPLFSPFAP